jgi:acetyl esterase/lipase
LLKSEDLKIILKGIVVLIIASFLANCSRDDKMNLPPEGYQLDILYGEVENYTGNDGQWLNVYQAAAETPTPVYIWAHGNGHTYRDAHEKYKPFVTELLENGISVVSWESIKQMDETNYPAILDDADLMFQWLKDNAATYNLDMTQVVIGGHSRGTIASWRVAQSGDAGIKGIYHGDAAGNLDDVNDALGDLITVNSPPIRMSYTQNKVTNDGQHDPNEGQKIIDRYLDLGFSEEDARLLENQGFPSMEALGFYEDLFSFCLYVLD